MTLFEQLRAATEKSRLLDFQIHIAVANDPIWPTMDRLGRVINPNSRMSDYLTVYRDVIDSDDQDFDFPRYTGSLDAAMTLVPAGCKVTLEIASYQTAAWVHREGQPVSSCYGKVRPAPIAICVAAMGVRLSDGQSEVGK